MDIRQLKYFVQIADSGNYSLASQKLFVSQPALSKTIKSMEEELGFEFFYTYQRRQHLTDAGQAFYDKAVHLIKEYNSLMNTAYDESGINKGHLTIGLSAAAGPALFGHISPRFAAMYPLIEVSITEKDTTTLKEEIFKRDTDAAFIDLSYIRKEEENLFDIFRIAESDLVVVVSQSNPLFFFKSIKYDDLDGKDLIIYQHEERSAGQLGMDLRIPNSRPHIVLTSSQWHLIFDLVEADLGITIAPYYLFDRFRVPGIKAIPIDEPSSKRIIALITKKDENRSKALRTFIEFASRKEQYSEMIYRLKV